MLGHHIKFPLNLHLEQDKMRGIEGMNTLEKHCILQV